MSGSRKIQWPEGKNFAFSVFDDTDLSTIENIRPVYALLEELGMRTTKSVWPIAVGKDPYIPGSTCEEPEYLEFIQDLRRKGFEIGYHLASYNSSSRTESQRALERFRVHFGQYPSAMAAHDSNREGMYWGDARFNGAHRLIYNALTRFRKKSWFRGHVEGDSHFWGDLCRDRIRYTRNFVFDDVNTLAQCPVMPYHDPDRPYVRAWYASSNGSEVNTFCKTLDERNVDRLENEGGACIMYTHFACGFAEGGKAHPRFREVMTHLSRKNGWFVPVTTLLDFLSDGREPHVLRTGERRRLERQWLWERIRAGRSA